jgi:RecA-family ATPase
MRIENDAILTQVSSEFNSLTNQSSAFQSALILKSANEWMNESKTRPIPKKLFGEFWYEGEICILFATTNLGKSILAVQIGEAIARQEQFPALPFLDVQAEPQKVFYLDCELSDKQFERRYSEMIEGSDFFLNHYEFSENFIRAEPNRRTMRGSRELSLEDQIIRSIRQAILETDARVVIVDNLTFLKTETEKGRDAAPLMQELESLQQMFDLSILVIGHTPKRDRMRPLTISDLGGSAHIGNFCDSAFAIGSANTDPRLRYLKQIKSRNDDFRYGEGSVYVCQLEKTRNFLGFQYQAVVPESDLLKEVTSLERDELIQKAKHLQSQGLSQHRIAIELNRSVGTINNWLRK